MARRPGVAQEREQSTFIPVKRRQFELSTPFLLVFHHSMGSHTTAMSNRQESSILPLISIGEAAQGGYYSTSSIQGRQVLHRAAVGKMASTG